MAQEQSVHEQPAHTVVLDALEEKNETKQSSWWNRWGKPRVADQVIDLIVLFFILIIVFHVYPTSGVVLLFNFILCYGLSWLSCGYLV